MARADHSRAVEAKNNYDDRLETWKRGVGDPQYDAFLAKQAEAEREVKEIESIIADSGYIESRPPRSGWKVRIPVSVAGVRRTKPRDDL